LIAILSGVVLIARTSNILAVALATLRDEG